MSSFLHCSSPGTRALYPGRTAVCLLPAAAVPHAVSVRASLIAQVGRAAAVHSQMWAGRTLTKAISAHARPGVITGSRLPTRAFPRRSGAPGLTDAVVTYVSRD